MINYGKYNEMEFNILYDYCHEKLNPIIAIVLYFIIEYKNI